MFKSFHRLVSACLCLLAVLGPAGAFAQDFPPDIQRIMDRGKLIVAMYHNDIPPFFMHDAQGNFYGVDVDLARDIAEKLGVQVEFDRRAKTFGEVIDIVTRHEADIAVSLLSRTLERSKRVTFTNPYIILRQGLLVNRVRAARQKQQGSDLLADLNHREVRIGVKAGTSYVAFAEERFPKAQIVQYPEWDPNIVEAVLKGDVVAAFHDEIEIKKLIIGKPDIALQLQTVVIKDAEDPIAMAVPWDSSHFASWLNLYLDAAKLHLTADGILKKYVSSIKSDQNM